MGLATSLLNIENLSQVARDLLRGHLVENLVLVELFKQRLNHGRDPQMYYYRNVQKNEIDILFKQGNLLTPIEIKSSKTYTPDFLKKLHFFQKLAGKRAPKSFLIYAGDYEGQIQSTRVLNYKNAKGAIS